MAAVNASNVIVKRDTKGMSSELAVQIEKIANAAIERDGSFKIGLTGGSLLLLLTEALVNIKTDWVKWYIFFCDERILTQIDVEPLHIMYENMFSQLSIPIPKENIVKVETDISPSESSKDYISKLALHFPPVQFPRFHLLLLGVGPDGHICSLFPNDDKVLSETSVWVAPVMNAPKPPPCRVTLTFPVINNAEHCIVTASGKEKCEILTQVFGGSDVPAAKVKLNKGTLLWILDESAAPDAFKSEIS
ncbi:hypothetical protein RUM43_005489 [Polyplax serrata]|uniref:6-phosphogluconolactonase n=1 Tax=Polyplax serrata TaxID=468196 RepID=A0AAN8P025_POLSC